MLMKSVPVEHRVLGLDKRKMAGTLGVLALLLLWAVVVPFIDSSIQYDNQASPGETFDVGSGITIVPPANWEVDLQTALTQGLLVVHNGGLTVTVTVGTFDGELSDLMASANDSLDVDRITKPQASITTTQGSTGLTESFDAANSHGTLSVFAEDGVGVEIEAIGPEPLATRYAEEVNAMTISLQFGASS